MNKILILFLTIVLSQSLIAGSFGEFVTEQDIQDQLSQTEILVKEGKATPADLVKLREEAQIALDRISRRSSNEQIEKFPEIRTRGGKVYRSVVVRKREPDGISVIHESGTAKIYFNELSQDLQQHFQYDAGTAKTYQQQQATKEYQQYQAEQERKIQRAEEEARVRQEESARQAKLREEQQRRQEELMARIAKEREAKAEAEKPILDPQVIRHEPQPGVFYDVPMPWQSLAFVKENGRKFYIPLKLKSKENLKIYIRGGQDNSGDGGMRWELRDYATKKKLDGGFTRDTGVYKQEVKDIPSQEVMLILFDDDSNFNDRQPGNGFSVAVGDFTGTGIGEAPENFR
jgi:hypothetical protein